MLVYCLINVGIGSVERIMNDIKAISDSIREVFILYGEYDFLVKMKADSLAEMNKLIASLKAVNGVREVTPLKVADKTRDKDVQHKK